MAFDYFQVQSHRFLLSDFPDLHERANSPEKKHSLKNLDTVFILERKSLF